MRESLSESLRLMFGHEGGYVNSKNDSGGPTKYGITHRTLAAHRGVQSVTAAQVKALTLAEAETIYRKSYWPQSGGDVLPVGLDYAAFDFGVNAGPRRAVLVLQKVLGVTQDGTIGPRTLAAVKAYSGGVTKLIRDYCNARMTYLKSLTGPKGFPEHGRGWTIRVTGIDPKGIYKTKPGVVGEAVRMAMEADSKNVPEQKPAAPASSPAPARGGEGIPATAVILSAIAVIAALFFIL